MGNRNTQEKSRRHATRELLERTSEQTAAISRNLAQKAIDSLESTSRGIKRYTPGNFAELTYRWVPFADPATFAQLIKRQMDYYTTITTGRDITPFERIAQSEITLTLMDGTETTVRAPQQHEREQLAALYSEGLTAEDIESRFFMDISADRAGKEGVGCSSLDLPDTAADLVAVTDNGTLIAHSGYATEGPDASLHISVHKDWRMRTENGERLSTIMFSRTVATALLDERVRRVSAETLHTNDKMNRLVATTMNPQGATQHDGDGFYTTTITKLLDEDSSTRI